MMTRQSERARPQALFSLDQQGTYHALGEGTTRLAPSSLGVAPPVLRSRPEWSQHPCPPLPRPPPGHSRDG